MEEKRIKSNMEVFSRVICLFYPHRPFLNSLPLFLGTKFISKPYASERKTVGGQSILNPYASERKPVGGQRTLDPYKPSRGLLPLEVKVVHEEWVIQFNTSERKTVGGQTKLAPYQLMKNSVVLNCFEKRASQTPSDTKHWRITSKFHSELRSALREVWRSRHLPAPSQH